MENLRKPLFNSSELTYTVEPSHLVEIFEKDADPKAALEKWGGIDKICSLIKTSKTDGITQLEDDANERKIYFGKNLIKLQPPPSLVYIICRQFADPLIFGLILLGAALVCFGINQVREDSYELKSATSLIEGSKILLMCLFICLIGGTFDYAIEVKLSTMNSESYNTNAIVRRSREDMLIPRKKVVVGDLVILNRGDIVPADGLLITAKNIEVEERREKVTHNATKNTENPILLGGSIVLEGQGMMIVCVVGKRAQCYKIPVGIRQVHTRGYLERQAEKFQTYYGRIMLLPCLAVFVVLATRDLLKFIETEKWELYNYEKIIGYLTVAISLVYVVYPRFSRAIPIKLTIAGQKLYRTNIHVSKPANLENFAHVSHLMLDKEEFLFLNDGSIRYEYPNSLRHDPAKSLLGLAICYTSDAYINRNPTYSAGNSLDKLLLKYSSDNGTEYVDVRHPDEVLWKKEELDIRISLVEQNNGIYLFARGSIKEITKRSKSYLKDAHEIKTTNEIKQSIYNEILPQISQRSVRGVAFGYKKLEEQEFTPEKLEKLSEELCFIGVIGAEDVCQHETVQDLVTLKRSGVNVIMISGDDSERSVAAGKQCGLLPSNFSMKINDFDVIEGKELRKIVGIKEPFGVPTVQDLEEFTKIIYKIKVVCCASIIDKQLLIDGLNRLEKISACTFSKIEEKKALEACDFSIGVYSNLPSILISEGDLVLKEISTEFLVTAMIWSRSVLLSTRKLMQLHLTTGLTAAILMVESVSISQSLPLQASNLLWIGFMISIFLTLALMIEPPPEHLLKRGPYVKNEHLITCRMLVNIVSQVLYQVSVLTLILFFGNNYLHLAPAKSLGRGFDSWNPDSTLFHFIFNTFIFMQIFFTLNCRRIGSRSKNPFVNLHVSPYFIYMFLATMGLEIFLYESRYIIVDSPYGLSNDKASDQYGLTFNQHLMTIGFSFGGVIFTYLVSLLPFYRFSKNSWLYRNCISEDPSD
jgi:calcium-translocating P-type ATPase